jgi:hypothetical protein
LPQEYSHNQGLMEPWLGEYSRRWVMANLLFLSRLHLQLRCNDLVQSISLPGKVDSSLCILHDVLQSGFYYVFTPCHAPIVGLFWIAWEKESYHFQLGDPYKRAVRAWLIPTSRKPLTRPGQGWWSMKISWLKGIIRRAYTWKLCMLEVSATKQSSVSDQGISG